MLRQKQLSAGIFACDESLVLGVSRVSYGSAMGELDMAICDEVPVGMSKDGTAGNALQFIKAWDVVSRRGQYTRGDWTIKADPDTVLMPDRLRARLRDHTGENVYIQNCDKPMSEGDMMFGCVEAISREAVGAYFGSGGRCSAELPWQSWGEDLFMMRCLEHLGVGSVGDFDLVQDGVCKGVWCGSPAAAAFHPMKSVAAWEDCWREAVAAR